MGRVARPGLRLLGLLAVAAVALPARGTVFFQEQFLDGEKWRRRWVLSEHRPDYGKFTLAAGNFYGDRELDKGLRTSEDARFYAASARFRPFGTRGRALVLQFSVKHEQRLDCGGGYAKLFPAGLDQRNLSRHSPYLLMFGPDICSSDTRKVQVLLGYKGKTYPIKKEIRCKVDPFTHLYSLALRPNGTYRVSVDGRLAAGGRLEDDWDFPPPGTMEPGPEGDRRHPEGPDPDDPPGVYEDLGVLGLELWQVRSGTIFDNFLLTDDEAYAEEFGEDTWGETKLSAGHPVYETYYKQVDPSCSGRIGASDAALFLKKSGLADPVLGKIWDLADPEGKGFLDKQGFFLALRLVACAQSGHEVGLGGLGLTLPPPKFHDSSSPSLAASSDAHWAVRVEERAKFDGIFESLLPVNGLLSGDKVKPVLINSKLPLDVLGRVWDLSDIDKDGHLDRDEFAVAMHLVYRALEKEPVPPALPPALVPPAKRRKGPLFPGAVPVLPASPPPRDSLRSTPTHGSASSLNSAGSLSPKPGLKPGQAPAAWVVPPADKSRYDDIFLKTDLDQDGFVSGLEVKDIFMHSGLSQTLLAHIWALADTRQAGKLSKDQFALAMHLIQQKVSKGVDPPQALPPEMVPPAERATPGPIQDGAGPGGPAEFAGMKELEEVAQEIAQLQREKFSLEQDIRERELAIRQKTAEVQELQNELDRESSGLQELEAQKQEARERLDEMEQQRAKLQGMLGDVRQKCAEEGQVVSSLRTQIEAQEAELRAQEADVGRARAELGRLQQEEAQLEQSLRAGRAQLETILKSLRSTQEEIDQARGKLSRLQEPRPGGGGTPNGLHAGGLSHPAETERGGPAALEDPFRSKAGPFGAGPPELPADPFQAEDPFRGTDPFRGSDPFSSDPFAEQSSAAAGPDPFGGDPFKESDPFRAAPPEDFFPRAERSDPFAADPFARDTPPPAKPSVFELSDPFLLLSSSAPKAPDPFGSAEAFGGGGGAFSGGGGGSEGFADFSRMAKPPPADPFAAFAGGAFAEDPFRSQADTPALPPKKGLPPRPKPPAAAWQ